MGRLPFSCASLEARTPFSNGEGNEGHEEEDREQDWQGPHGQCNGAPWHQGQDYGWPDSKGPDPEQEWQDCEQEGQPCQEEQPWDDCRQEVPRRLEDQGLLRHQEGHVPVPQGQGVLQLSAADLSQM